MPSPDRSPARPSPARPAVAAALALLALLALLAACGLQACGPLPAAGAPRPVRRSGVAVEMDERWQTGSLTLAEIVASRFGGARAVGSGDASSLRLRAPATILGSTEPLVVVDGSPLPGGSYALNLISPADVRRVEVLKDPAATAAYGSRGGNGVVLVTTKRRAR